MDARTYDADNALVSHDVDQGDGTAHRFTAVDGTIDYDGPFDVVDATPGVEPSTEDRVADLEAQVDALLTALEA